MESFWKALVCEFLGTMILVFIGAGAVSLSISQGGSLVGSALAFGLVFMTLIYAFGSYSGAHLNPAVSFGYAVAGEMGWLKMLGYWVAQILGGIVGAALVAWYFGTSTGAGVSVGSLTYTESWKALLVEASLTFILVLVILIISKNPYWAIISGLAIGLVLTFDMLAGSPLTGASMNPARSFGPAIFGGTMNSIWIYILGPLLGALIAAIVFRLLNATWKKDDCCKPVELPCKKRKEVNCMDYLQNVKDCSSDSIPMIHKLPARKTCPPPKIVCDRPKVCETTCNPKPSCDQPRAAYEYSDTSYVSTPEGTIRENIDVQYNVSAPTYTRKTVETSGGRSMETLF